MRPMFACISSSSGSKAFNSRRAGRDVGPAFSRLKGVFTKAVPLSAMIAPRWLPLREEMWTFGGEEVKTIMYIIYKILIKIV